MTRAEALAAAVTLVDELAPRVNGRGYPDGTIKADERVSLVLRVASWLLVDDDTPSPLASAGRLLTCFRCERADGDVIDRGPGYLSDVRYMHVAGICP